MLILKLNMYVFALLPAIVALAMYYAHDIYRMGDLIEELITDYIMYRR